MPRLVGVDIPNERPLWIALTYIHGIGRTQSKKLLQELEINPFMRARDLGEEEAARIAGYIEKNLTVEGALRRQVQQNIQRLKDIRSYRGMRHRLNLPARGQRTRCNARTRKGHKRKTVAGRPSVKKK